MRRHIIVPFILCLSLAVAFLFIRQTSQPPAPQTASPSSPISYPSIDPLFLERAFKATLPWSIASSTRIALVPHHLVAAREMASLFSRLPQAQTIIILSPDHFQQGKTLFTVPISNLCQAHTTNPCAGGTLDQASISHLIQTVPNLSRDDEPFKREHGIYALLPFLARTHPQARIIPLLISTSVTEAETQALTQAITGLLQQDPNALLLGSIDMSHYQIQEVADFHDTLTKQVIQTVDSARIPSLEIDSPGTLFVTLGAANRLGLQARIHSHTNSLVLARALLAKESTSHIIASFHAANLIPDTKASSSFITEFWHQLPAIPTEENRLYHGFDRERIFDEPRLPFFFGIVRDGDVISVYPFPLDEQRSLLTREARQRRIRQELPQLRAWLNRELQRSDYQLIY